MKDEIASTADPVPWDDDEVLRKLPVFQRGIISPVDDKLTLTPEESEADDKDSGGLQALVDKVGLVPAEAVTAEHTERVRIFDEKSRRLSEFFTESWVKDVQAELVPFNQDRELGLAILLSGFLRSSIAPKLWV